MSYNTSAMDIENSKTLLQFLNAVSSVDKRNLYTFATVAILLIALFGCQASPVQSTEAAVATPTPGPTTYVIEDWLRTLCDKTPGLMEAEYTFLLNPGDRVFFPQGLEYEQTDGQSIQVVTKARVPVRKIDQCFARIGEVNFRFGRIPGDTQHSALDANMQCPLSSFNQAPDIFIKDMPFSAN